MKALLVFIPVLFAVGATSAAEGSDKPATQEQMSAVVEKALEVSAAAAQVIDQQRATEEAFAKIQAEVAEFAKIKAELEAENAALREALQKKVGKTEAQLIEEANRANIRAARIEGELNRLKAAPAADPFMLRGSAPLSPASADPLAPNPATPAKPKTWQTVQLLQGTGNKRGPKFTVWGEWRAHWQFAAGEYGLFIAQIEGDDAADTQMLVNTTQSGRDVTMGKGVGDLTLAP
jgi:hypothetical protein